MRPSFFSSFSPGNRRRREKKMRRGGLGVFELFPLVVDLLRKAFFQNERKPALFDKSTLLCTHNILRNVCRVNARRRLYDKKREVVILFPRMEKEKRSPEQVALERRYVV